MDFEFISLFCLLELPGNKLVCQMFSIVYDKVHKLFTHMRRQLCGVLLPNLPENTALYLVSENLRLRPKSCVVVG